jgi:hypothetical protein
VWNRSCAQTPTLLLLLALELMSLPQSHSEMSESRAFFDLVPASIRSCRHVAPRKLFGACCRLKISALSSLTSILMISPASAQTIFGSALDDEPKTRLQTIRLNQPRSRAEHACVRACVWGGEGGSPTLLLWWLRQARCDVHERTIPALPPRIKTVRATQLNLSFTKDFLLVRK